MSASPDVRAAVRIAIFKCAMRGAAFSFLENLTIGSGLSTIVFGVFLPEAESRSVLVGAAAAALLFTLVMTAAKSVVYAWVYRVLFGNRGDA